MSMVGDTPAPLLLDVFVAIHTLVGAPPRLPHATPWGTAPLTMLFALPDPRGVWHGPQRPMAPYGCLTTCGICRPMAYWLPDHLGHGTVHGAL